MGIPDSELIPDHEYEPPTLQERIDSHTQPYRRVMQLLAALAITLLAVIVVATLWLWYRQNRDEDTRAQVGDIQASLNETRNDLSRLADGVDTLRDQLLANSLTPVVPPADNLVGETGPPMPEVSFAVVATAVEEYCTKNNNCTGPSVTFEQVEAAVASYCADHDGCLGPAGTPGEKGDTGDAGVQGEPGESVTEEMVAAAVASYCSDHNDCMGPQGEQGPIGPIGPAGPAGTGGCPEGYSPVTVTIPSEPELIFSLCAAPAPPSG